MWKTACKDVVRLYSVRHMYVGINLISQKLVPPCGKVLDSKADAWHRADPPLLQLGK